MTDSKLEEVIYLCVIIDGYKFSKSREMKDEKIYFRFTDHNCKSSAVICKYIEQIIIIMSTIIHPFQTVLLIVKN